MKAVCSNIDGVIAEVKVSVGDVIVRGQEVVNVESMKSIISVVSEIGGVVKEIKVTEGDFISEDDPLIFLE
jgi:acetyl-CoA carboxylase biotin carboxyl carrier protein